MSHAGHEVPAAHDLTEHKGLNEGALTFFGTLMIGLASVAPAYSLAATLGYVVIEDGTLAPVAVVLGFIPMLLTAFAYRELNKVIPDCGTTFTWVTKAFGPRTGWFSGYVLTIAGIIVLANLAQVAAQYTFLLLGADSLAENTFWVTVLGVVFIAVMAWVSYRGIVIAEWLQNVLVAIQYLALGVLVVVALIAVAARTGRTLQSRSRRPGSIHWASSPRTVAVRGADRGHAADGLHLLGWDTILSLNEETKEREKTPGRAAVAATLILVATYLLTTVAAISYAGVGTGGIGLGNEDNAGDVFQAISEPVLGDWSWIVLVAVLVSAVASTQTTILPAARGTLAMGVYRALRSSRRCIQVQDADRLDSVHRWGRDRDLRSAQPAGGERVRRRAAGHRSADLLLLRHNCLRVRLVLPQGHRPRWQRPVDQGDPADAGRTDPAVRVREERDRHVVARLRLPGRLDRSGDQHGDRQRVPAWHRLDRPRPADHVLDRARRSEQKAFFRGESLHHDTPVLAPD